MKNAPAMGTANYDRLKLMVETMSGVPWLLDIAGQYIKSNQASFTGDVYLSPEIVRALYVKLCESALGRSGGGHSMVSDVRMDAKRKALIHQTETELDVVSSDLITVNYFSRHPERFNKAGEPVVKFVPRATMAMLAASEARDATELEDTTQLLTKESVDFNNHTMLFYNTFVSILNVIYSKSKEGSALEEAGVSWLIAKLVSARKVGMSSISLRHLLVGDVVPPGSPMDINISTPYPKAFYEADDTILPPISTEAAKYADSFNELVEVDALQPCKIYKSSLNQSYDSMVVSEREGAVHVLFIDMKSKAVIGNSTGQASKSKHKRLDIDQYYFVERMVEELKKRNPSELSTVSRALVAGNYTFVYMTTHDNVKAYHNGVRLASCPPKVVIMEEPQTKAFMGILWDFYQSARSVLYPQ
jgi:hypothetical protein